MKIKPKVIKKDVVKLNDKYKLTLEMMEGYNPNFKVSRFQRDSITDTWRPLYLILENEKISTDDYSDTNIFVGSDYNWKNRLELPYTEKVKKLELIRKNGEIINVKVRNSNDAYISINTENPIVKIRVY